MSEDYIVHIKGDAVQENLKSRGPWVVASIEQSIGWTEEDIIINYEGSDVYLFAYCDERDLMPAVAIRLSDGIDNESAKAKITRFLSALNWVSDGSIRLIHWLGGSHPFRSKNTNGMKHTAKSFRITYLPSNLSQEQQLALALLREGDYLRPSHYGYSFLSYYKIINLVKKNGEKQKKWIRNNIDDLQGDSQKRIAELKKDGEIIEDYLFHSCRCALAHAGVDPTINPDDVDDSIRLYKDLPLIRDLAKKIIENHFSIKSDETIYHEHLYELSGFKKLLGEELVSEILNNDAISRRKVKIDKKISIRQWCDKRYGVFESLNLKTKMILNGTVIFDCINDDLTFKVGLILDLKDERVFLEIEDVEITADIEKTKIQYTIDYLKYFKDFICNGQLEIFVESNNQFLGRKDANIPCNIDLGSTVKNYNNMIAQLEQRFNEIA